MQPYGFRLKGGTNVALINGLLHVILKEGLENKEFIQQRTENIDMLRQVVAQYTPEKSKKLQEFQGRHYQSCENLRRYKKYDCVWIG